MLQLTIKPMQMMWNSFKTSDKMSGKAESDTHLGFQPFGHASPFNYVSQSQRSIPTKLFDLYFANAHSTYCRSSWQWWHQQLHGWPARLDVDCEHNMHYDTSLTNPFAWTSSSQLQTDKVQNELENYGWVAYRSTVAGVWFTSSGCCSQCVICSAWFTLAD